MIGRIILIVLILAVVIAAAVLGSGAVDPVALFATPTETPTLTPVPTASPPPPSVTAITAPSPSPTTVPVVSLPTVIVTPLSAATATATPTPAPSPTVTPAFVQVANTGGDGVFMRLTPNLADRLKAWDDGTIFTVIGPDVESDGIIWRHVRAPDGSEGYMPVQYVPPLPTGTVPLATVQFGTVELGNTNGDGAFLRLTPNLDDRLTAWSDGTVFTVIGGDVRNDDGTWKHVRAPDGTEGYLPVRFIVASLTATASPRVPTATVTASTTRVPPTPTPSPTSPPSTVTATPKVTATTPVGAVRVAHTDGDGAFLHRRPATSEFLSAWPDSTLLTIVGADVDAGGSVWKHVRAPDGAEGYIPERYTAPATPE
ncbi:MAG: hypothetical protein CL878_11885 [Dehalococcoidia bacterium]|nr:hypothetical protein [Dehalococcoidia bacterium]